MYTSYPRKLSMSLVYSLLKNRKLCNTWFLSDISNLLLTLSILNVLQYAIDSIPK